MFLTDEQVKTIREALESGKNIDKTWVEGKKPFTVFPASDLYDVALAILDAPQTYLDVEEFYKDEPTCPECGAVRDEEGQRAHASDCSILAKSKKVDAPSGEAMTKILKRLSHLVEQLDLGWGSHCESSINDLVDYTRGITKLAEDYLSSRSAEKIVPMAMLDEIVKETQQRSGMKRRVWLPAEEVQDIVAKYMPGYKVED